jgi:ATP-dependent Clp protease ATP-binding subunit ClpC
MRNSDRFTEKAKAALSLAPAAAAELGHRYVGTEHMLLGIAREGEGLGAKVLRDHGIDANLVAELVERFVGRGTPAPPPRA